jgi:hypothetical protein
MRTLQRLFVLAVSFVFVLALASREARAQSPSLTGIEGQVLRCEPPLGTTCNAGQNADSANANPHPGGVPENTINFEDCEANLYYQLELGVSSPDSAYILEAWAGTEDCSQLANRQTAATAVCWPLTTFLASDVSTAIVNVRVRDIAAGAFGPPSVTYIPTGTNTPDDAVCRSQTQSGPTALTLYFFFADVEGNPYGKVQKYPVTLDLLAGKVQGNVSLDIGDDALTVNVPPTTDPSTVAYNVYCDPPPGGASDAGAADSGASSSTCASSVLAGVPGGGMVLAFQYGQPDAKYLCGTGPASQTSIDLAGLKNGSFYDVAVAAVDGAGNVGPLSNAACDEPLQSAGAPGVSCSARGVGALSGTGGLGVLMVASIVAMARRRRRAS